MSCRGVGVGDGPKKHIRREQKGDLQWNCCGGNTCLEMLEAKQAHSNLFFCDRVFCECEVIDGSPNGQSFIRDCGETLEASSKISNGTEKWVIFLDVFFFIDPGVLEYI